MRPRRPRAARGRVGGREPVLQLVTGPRERPRERVVGVPDHPGEDLGRGARARRRRADAGGPAQRARAPGCEGVADRRGEQQRADQVRAAALVLLPARLAVLVRPDRDVLGAVVGGELGAAERQHRRRERERARRAARCAAGPSRRASARRWTASAVATIAPSTSGPLERAAAPPAARAGSGAGAANASSRRAGPRSSGFVTSAPRSASCARRDPELAVVGADGDRPGGRPVHEHAVLQRHPAEADLLVGHAKG